MRTDINTLNEITKNLVDGEIKADNLKDNIAEFIGINNNEENSQTLDDIIYDLKSANVITPNGDEYNIMSPETFHDIAKDDIAHINFAVEDMVNENGVEYTKFSPIDTQKEAYLSSDITILGSKELQGEWDENRIQNAQNGKPHEYDFTKCENINLISGQLRAEIENTPGVDGGFSAKFPVDKEILAMGGDMMRKAYMTDPIEFENGDAVILNGYAYTFNKDLDGFIKEQIAVDTVGESQLDSQIPSVIEGHKIYMSKDIATKVIENQELTPEEEEQIVFVEKVEPETEEIETNETIEENTQEEKGEEKPQVDYTGRSAEDTMEKIYKTNRHHYEAMHPGDEYEESLANELNEIEYRRIESEAKLNKLKNDLRDARKQLFKGPWYEKLFKALFSPIKAVFRLAKQLLGKEINYTPEEQKVRILKEQISQEEKRAININKDERNLTKLHGIEVDREAIVTAPVERTEKTSRPATEKTDPVVSEPEHIEEDIVPETKETNEQVRRPNTTQLFAQTLQGVCTDYNLHINAYGEKDVNGKYKTAIELTSPHGDVTKFHFDANRGTLEPVSFSVEQSFSQTAIDDIKMRANIAHTLATVMSGKPAVSEKSMEYINTKAIEPLLSGEKNEASFKFGSIPVDIAMDDSGQYCVKFANKDTKQGEIKMYTTKEGLSPENVHNTLNNIRVAYAFTMYKSFTNDQFIDFVKDSKVVNGTKGAFIDSTEKSNESIKFNIRLPDKETGNETKVPLILSTETFSISCPDREAESLMTNAQKVAFSKMASRLEEAYASFTFSKSKVPVQIVLPSADSLQAELNKRINAVEQGDKGTFFAYGLKVEVNKEEADYPTLRVSTKDNAILQQMPLYEQELSIEDLGSFYGEIAKGLQMSASKYDRAESAILNSESQTIGVGDVVLDEELADFTDVDAIAEENKAINDILATIDYGDR